MQGSEGPQTQLGSMLPGQLRANVKNRFRHGYFHPQTGFPVLLEPRVVMISFASRKRPTKDVLFDGMSPLDNVKGRHPHDLTRSHKVLGFCCVHVG